MSKYKTKYKWCEREEHFKILKLRRELDRVMPYSSIFIETKDPDYKMFEHKTIRQTGGISSSLFGSDMSPDSGGALDEESGTTSPE